MFLKVQTALFGLIFLACFSPTTAHADDEIRIDLPAGAQLKVRNDFGNVSAEVWANSYLAVSAVVGGDGARTLSRSPIIIDNRGSLLTISVVRRPQDPIVPIHLKIKVPDNADITARSLHGSVNSSLSGSLKVESQPFQTRLGDGARKIDIQIKAGDILLGYSSVAVNSIGPNPKEPELIGKNNSKAPAGTPDGPVPGDDIAEG